MALKSESNAKGRVLTIERSFDAPKEMVFKAYSESEQLENWWGPEGWETENKTLEFKPGGVWHYRMKCIDKNQEDFYGQESWGLAFYKEINEPDKIIYSDFFSDEYGNASTELPETLNTVKFIEEDGKTKISIISEFASEQDLQTVVEMGVVEGVDSQYNRLDKHLERASESAK